MLNFHNSVLKTSCLIKTQPQAIVYECFAHSCHVLENDNAAEKMLSFTLMFHKFHISGVWCLCSISLYNFHIFDCYMCNPSKLHVSGLQGRVWKKMPTWWFVCWSVGLNAWALPCEGKVVAYWGPCKMAPSCPCRLQLPVIQKLHASCWLWLRRRTMREETISCKSRSCVGSLGPKAIFFIRIMA